MICSSLIFILLYAGTAPTPSHLERLAPVQISRQPSAIDGHELHVSRDEDWRVRHFLRHVFPLWQMRRFNQEHAAISQKPSLPSSRTVEYALVKQQNRHFAVVHFQTVWNAEGTDATNVLAVYRIEQNGPNQIWRSKPWQNTYRGFRIQTANSGRRNIILFEEGGENNGFGLAGLFSFYNEPKGLYLRVLTPELPRLRAVTRFPVRPMLARDITLVLGSERQDVLLKASDEPFDQSSPEHSRTTRRWIFNHRSDAFEPTMPTESALK